MNEKLMGELSQATKSLKEDVFTLFQKDTNRKDETVGLTMAIAEERSKRRLDLEKVLHAVEESNTIASNVVKKVDGMSGDMHKIATKVEALSVKVNDMENAMTIASRNSFNWSKFMSGMSKPHVLIPVLISVCLMTLAIFAPEALPDFFTTVAKAK